MSSDIEEEVVPDLEVKEGAKKTDSEGKKTKSKKKKLSLTINLSNCKYDSVRRVAKRFGLRPVGEGEEWTVFWIDTSVILDRVMNMKRYQKINHFPGMSEICRKDLLARNMNRMVKLFPKEYNVFPKSWCMPADYGDFKAYCRAHKAKTFITKPENSSQGKGIVVFKNPKEIRAGEHSIVQQYIAKPFIIDGFKFDLRIYVVVTSCDPFRIYVYKDGLARFATVKYLEPTGANVGKQCMHLTNYSINKHSKDFVRDDDSGSKRRITTVNQWLADNGYNLAKIWGDIDDVIIKTLISAHPTLKHNYRSCFPNHNIGSACFEILGFDVLLDSKLKPWLVEVNHSPSFHTDSPLDKEVKEGLLFDTLNLIDLYANDKRKCDEEDKRRVQDRLLAKQKPKETSTPVEDNSRAKYEARLEGYEKTHKGGLRRIYPNGNEDYYAPFFNQSSSLCAETAASKMRVELSRQQREDIEAKQKEIESFKRKFSGKSKTEDLSPESPRSDKKPSSAKSAIRKQRAMFRVSLYNNAGHKVKSDDMASSDDGASPQAIRDVEELERLARLQMRDSLVRGLGVSEQLQAVLDTDPTPSPTRAPSVVPSLNLLSTYSSSYQPDSDIDVSTGSGGSIPTEGSYPVESTGVLNFTSLSSLPGSSYFQLGSNSKTAYHSMMKRHSIQQGKYSYPASARSPSAVYTRPVCAYGNRLTHPGPVAAGPMDRRSHDKRSHRQPHPLDLNADLFALSVVSSPIKLAIRKQYSSQPPLGGVRGIPQHSSSNHFAALS